MRRSWTVERERDIPAGVSRAIQGSIQGSFPPAALLLTLAGYAIVFGFLAARPLLPPGVTMQISTTSGLPRPRSPRLAHHVAI